MSCSITRMTSIVYNLMTYPTKQAPGMPFVCVTKEFRSIIEAQAAGECSADTCSFYEIEVVTTIGTRVTKTMLERVPLRGNTRVVGEMERVKQEVLKQYGSRSGSGIPGVIM